MSGIVLHRKAQLLFKTIFQHKLKQISHVSPKMTSEILIESDLRIDIVIKFCHYSG